MSLQCLLVRRRLLLLSQIIRHGNAQMLALLSTTRRDGCKLSWVQAVIIDMHVLFDNSGGKLQELGLPSENAEAWWAFIRDHPNAWAALVRRMHLSSMSFDEALVAKHLAGHAGACVCKICSCCFSCDRALQSHIRRKHNKVSDVSRFVGQSLRCCVCRTLFSTRTRLVAHLSDKRCRGSRSFNCRDVLQSGFVQQACEQEFTQAHLSDRDLRKQARKRGLTQPHAIFPAKRAKHGASISSVAMASTDDIPSNSFDWHNLPPAKRLRFKTPVETVMSHWIQQAAAVHPSHE